MTEENKQPAKEEKKKIEAKPLPVDKEKTTQIEKKQSSTAEKPSETKEKSKEEKTDDKKKEKEKPQIKKKHEAIARATSYPISKKQAMYICRFIKNKSPDQAIAELTQVINMKKPIPFKGEIPHRKGPMSSGRYPIKACNYFINLLKALKGNIIVNGLEIETTRISEASASWAARPMRRGGRSAKRTNVILKAKEFKGENK